MHIHICVYTHIYIYIYIYMFIHIDTQQDWDCRKLKVKIAECLGLNCGGAGYKPSPPTKSFDFRGFDSSRLLILRGGSSHVRGLL